jgi:hypothetical protein
MPCPRCGGISRKSIAPGHWQCTTVIDDPAFPRSAWDEADPWRAATHPTRPCGHRYEEDPTFSTDPCRCGIHSIGRCVHCGSPVCGFHGRLYEDTLHCDDCRQVFLRAIKERERMATEQAENAAAEIREKLERNARAAVQRAVDGLVASGRRSEALATIEHVNTPRGPGGGAINWYLVKERMGQGWYVGQLEWRSIENGAATSTRLVLSEDGRLLEGARYVGPKIRPGRYLSVFRSEVIAVAGVEFHVAQCGNDSVEDLTSGLLEIAAGDPKPLSWARLP